MSVEYFPLYLRSVLQFGGLCVKLVDERDGEYYTKRILEIYYGREHKVLLHYQMNCKKDAYKTLYANNFVPLVKIMNENYGKMKFKPIVVHCKYGVERTAVLILSDIAFQMAKEEGYIDVYLLANRLRKQRPNMITSEHDYLLAHLVISECLMEEQKVLKTYCANPNKHILSQQLRYLDIYKWHDYVIHDHTPSLCVSSHKGKVKFIYSELPTVVEMPKFWKFLRENELNVMIFINESKDLICSHTIALPEYKKGKFITKSTRRTQFGEIAVLSMEEINIKRKVTYNAEIAFMHLSSEITNSLQSLEKLLHLVECVRKMQPLPSQILICCNDTTSGCGIFLAIFHIISKYLDELEYDLANAVRTIRRSNTDFISKLRDLDILYKAITIYSEKFDPYKSIE